MGMNERRRHADLNLSYAMIRLSGNFRQLNSDDAIPARFGDGHKTKRIIRNACRR